MLLSITEYIFDMIFLMFIPGLLISDTFLCSGTLLFSPYFLFLASSFWTLLCHFVISYSSFPKIWRIWYPNIFFSFQGKFSSNLDSSLHFFFCRGEGESRGGKYREETNKCLHRSPFSLFCPLTFGTAILYWPLCPQSDAGKFSLTPDLVYLVNIWILPAEHEFRGSC